MPVTATSSDDIAIAGLYGTGWLLCYESLAELAGLAPTTMEALGVARSSSAVVDAARTCLALVPEEQADHLVGSTRSALASVQRHTPSASWAEALLKNVLLIGAGMDLADHTSAQWPPAVAAVLEHNPGRELAELLTQTLSDLELDDEQVSRTSLFGRRVVAELSAQAQRIVSRDTRLIRALTGVEGGTTDEVSRAVELLQTLVEGAAQRMLALGFQP